MSLELAYPVTLTPDEIDGGFVVTFQDVPEAITQGEDLAGSLGQASDALEEAIAGRIRRGDPIPEPSEAAAQLIVPVPALTAAKAALYLALRDSGITKSELAARLRCDEKEVRRLLDPTHHSKLSRIQEALAVLGKRLAVRVIDEAA
ncbi:MAG TPA: type II toxin-antitoxin system HicB family antitoxin [Thermoanaerobaculia bacterium]|jgi:antitoxin HicB|nr:type II toxin-antitoxin system HicB family antitoxin [Thermoanaerobaculia bacterium]